MFRQDGCGHGAYAAWHRSCHGCFFLDLAEIHIPAEFPVRTYMNPYIHYHRPRRDKPLIRAAFADKLRM